MPAEGLLAALCAGVAVLLAGPARPHWARDGGPRRRRWVRPGLVTVVALGAVLVVPPGRIVLVTITGAAALAAWSLVARRRRTEQVLVARGEVAAFCEALAAEVRAGQPASTALVRAGADWPRFAEISRAQRLGGDVVAAFRVASAADGCTDLRLVGAAWAVTQQSGAGLARALTRVSGLLAAEAATRRVVRAELASARATARLLALLPVFALLMGRGIGGDPFGFLFATPAGLGCLAGGLALGFAGLWWIEAIADGIGSRA